jgi:nucleotide-binding universal stress UspA family protein
MKPIKTILHPTDLSDGSQQALKLAGFLARDQKAQLIILHVVPRLTPVTGPGDVAALSRAEKYQQDLKSYQDEMNLRLAKLTAPDPKVPVIRLLKEGEVTSTILRTAHETPCDLIVMGSHGQGAQFTRPMGSVAQEVSRKAPCPVVTVTLPV